MMFITVFNSIHLWETFSSLLSSMLSISITMFYLGGSRLGWLLNRFATNARLSLSCPLTTSLGSAINTNNGKRLDQFTFGVTKALLLIFSAWSNIVSALSRSSFFSRASLSTPASLGAIWAINSVYTSLSLMSSWKFLILLDEPA